MSIVRPYQLGGSTTLTELTVQSGADIDNETLVVNDSTDRVGVGLADPKTKLTVEGSLTMKEQAAADADTAAYGQVWVKTATPNQLWFTNDAGTDTQLGTGGGGTPPDGSVTPPTLDLTSVDDTNIVYKTTGTQYDDPPAQIFLRDSTTVADDMDLGSIICKGKNSVGAEIDYVKLTFEASDVTATKEGGTATMHAYGGGTAGTASSIRAFVVGHERVGATKYAGVYVNPDQERCEFIVHSDTATNLIRTNGEHNVVGIGGFPSNRTGHILEITSTDKGVLLPRCANDPSSPVNGCIYYNTTNQELRVRANGAWVALT